MCAELALVGFNVSAIVGGQTRYYLGKEDNTMPWSLTSDLLHRIGAEHRWIPVVVHRLHRASRIDCYMNHVVCNPRFPWMWSRSPRMFSRHPEVRSLGVASFVFLCAKTFGRLNISSFGKSFCRTSTHPAFTPAPVHVAPGLEIQ